MLDVLVAGAGPAGSALAKATARLGLRTAVVDPAAGRPWRATYASWADELPAGVPLAFRSERTRAAALTEHVVDRSYAVIDNEALRADLDDERIAVHQARAVKAHHDRDATTVLLDNEDRIRAGVVVDATGSQQALLGTTRRRTPAEQSAVGVVIPLREQGFVDKGEALFMDWREKHEGRPSFLYAVPLNDDEVLLEETSLADRPAMSHRELRDRLVDRLRRNGIPLHGNERWERVRFPMDDPLPRPQRVVPFGAAAPFVHPATGYSVAGSLTLAPRLAQALALGLDEGEASRAGWRTVWPTQALAVHGLRRVGLRVLLGLSAADVPRFFEAFFLAPTHLQNRYLAGRCDLPGTLRAMTAVIGAAPPALRARVAALAMGMTSA
ncbi:lycopene cyclase family protein [Allokutzneria albata]|uniref:Lycopene cyclase (CrtL-type) n=1 Tax=Allokutzneria albata TaxID=211114 RepID=A0A1G9R639_ALLAB|nr:lycopene cyclase family protein [Allokutzneria albata]SDM18580.1 lycopene cyclase (CrtL-type) [Allokutzneria albata]